MDKLKLELDVLLPENGECERCVDRLQTSLQQHRGVEQAHVDREGPASRLCLHYDPELISLAEIERRAQEAGAVVQARYHHRELDVEGMDCADCATKLEQGVGRLDGVLYCSVNFAAAKMRVEYDAKQLQPEAVNQRVRKMGYSVREAGVVPRATSVPAPGGRLARLAARLRSRPRDLLTLLSGLLLLLALALELAHVGPAWATSAVLALSMVFGGYYVFRKGITNLVLTRQLDINFLMTIAALGAAAIGEWAEAALVVFLFSLGETLESYTMDRARNSIRSLMQLAPAEATLVETCVDCAEHLGQLLADGTTYASGVCPWCSDERRVPVAELEVGDLILAKPGERIPMDGVVRSGASAVNQAPITGESVPVEKQVGNDVFAGSINGAGALEIEVTRLAADNTISRIIHMVEEAQAQKAPSQRWVDTFARYYTPAVVGLAVLVAVVPPLLFGQPFLDPTGSAADGTHGWLYRALALLITACPCALVISTPVSIVSGISRAAQLGVLIKGGAYLEAAGGLKVIAFDKTGTLTRGEPAVTHVVSLNGAGEDGVLQVAAAIEARSEHPLARAIVAQAEARSLAYRPAEGFRAAVGRGAEGLVNGEAARVGNLALFTEANIALPPAAADSAMQLERAGNTVMLVHGAAVPGRAPAMLGLVAVADTIRPDALAATAALKAAGIRQTVMLTGDNERTARAIARQAGVDEVRANLLPDGKVQAIEKLLDEYGQVAMVGDGVNDAPALARATVGIAMGGAGTDQALETADVVLMGDDLLKLPFAIRLSRQTLAVLRQNIAFALLMKAVVMVLVLAGVASLWVAVLADVGTSLVVIGNGMRLLRAKA
jgi:Zn2+/Cd2+-exporting ATPase